MKHPEYFFRILLISLIVLVGCKKEEIIQNTTVVSYIPKDIKGNWLLTEAYDKNSTSNISYPINLDSSILRLKDISSFNLNGACNGGAGKYIFSESGGFQVFDFNRTQLACQGSVGVWDGIFIDNVEKGFHYDLASNNQTLRIYSSGGYDLILMKLN